jgi:hypothetical protein
VFQINRTKTFEKINFGITVHLSLQSYYAKHLTSLYSVSIVERVRRRSDASTLRLYLENGCDKGFLYFITGMEE